MKVWHYIVFILAFMLVLPAGFASTLISYDFETESEFANLDYNNSQLTINLTDYWSTTGSYSLNISWDGYQTNSVYEYMAFKDTQTTSISEPINMSINMRMEGSGSESGVAGVLINWDNDTKSGYRAEIAFNPVNNNDYRLRAFKIIDGQINATLINSLFSSPYLHNKNITFKVDLNSTGFLRLTVLYPPTYIATRTATDTDFKEGKFGLSVYTSTAWTDGELYLDNISFASGGYFTGGLFTINLESPTNNYRDNSDPTNFTFNVTHADNVTVPCDLYIDSIKNATNSSVQNNTASFFSVSMSEGSHTWYVNCTDLDETQVSSIWTYVADYTEPFLNSVSPVLANTTLYINYTMNIIGNLTDNSIYRVNRTIYYPNGSIYYSNYSGDLAVNTTVYSWDTTFNTTNEPNGDYEYFIQATDSHTKKYFPDAKQVKVDNSERKLAYEFDEGYVNISLVSGNVLGQFESISTSKLTDRYTFELNFKSIINPNSIMMFRVEAEEPMKYLSGSPYQGHMILYDKYWVDFMGVDGQYDVTCIDYYNEGSCYSYDVEIITANGNDKFVFNSLGGLNEAEYEITFAVNNCVTAWSCSDYASCNISDLSPCNDTIDLNACGLPYGGDYSEFTPQACGYCSPLATITYSDSTCPILNYRNTSIIVSNHWTCCNITQLASDCYCSQNETLLSLPSFYRAYCNFTGFEAYITNVTWHTAWECGYNASYGAEDINEMAIDYLGISLRSFINWIPLIVIAFFISAMVTIFVVYRNRLNKGDS